MNLPLDYICNTKDPQMPGIMVSLVRLAFKYFPTPHASRLEGNTIVAFHCYAYFHVILLTFLLK